MSCRDPDPPLGEVRLDAVDHGAELDADTLVGLDDQTAAVGGRRGRQRAMSGASGGGPHVGERIGFHDAGHGLGDEVLESVGGGRLQQAQRLHRARRKAEIGDAVEDAAGELTEVDLCRDPRHGLVDDQRLHGGIVHEGCERVDERVLFDELHARPGADDRDGHQDRGDDDADRRQDGAPTAALSGRRCDRVICHRVACSKLLVLGAQRRELGVQIVVGNGRHEASSMRMTSSWRTCPARIPPGSGDSRAVREARRRAVAIRRRAAPPRSCRARRPRRPGSARTRSCEGEATCARRADGTS